MRKYLLHSPVHYIIASAISLLTALILFIENSGSLLLRLGDALTTGGAVSVLLGLLFWVAAQGEFDIFGYAFRAASRKYKDLYEYSRIKAEKRSRRDPAYLIYIVTGLIIALPGIVCLIIK